MMGRSHGTPPEVVMEVDPPRSGHGSGHPPLDGPAGVPPSQKWSSQKWSSWKLTRVTSSPRWTSWGTPQEVVITEVVITEVVIMEVVIMEVDQGTPPGWMSWGTPHGWTSWGTPPDGPAGVPPSGWTSWGTPPLDGPAGIPPQTDNTLAVLQLASGQFSFEKRISTGTCFFFFF